MIGDICCENAAAVSLHRPDFMFAVSQCYCIHRNVPI